MLKALAWLTGGVVVGLLVHSWLTPSVDPPQAGAADAARPGELAGLRRRVAELETAESDRSRAYAELERRAAALEAQLGRLADELARGATRSERAIPTPSREAVASRPAATPRAASGLPGDGLAAAPASLRGVEAVPGEVLIFELTGSTDGGVWGSDVYTDDSRIAAAAVHAGLLQPDETGTIMVSVLPGRAAYTGSFRYGVASRDFGSWERSYSLNRLY